MLLFSEELLTKLPGESSNPHEMGFEMAVPIVGRISVDGDYNVKTLSGEKVVSVIHTGPYHEVGEAYTKALDYINASGLKLRGPCRELYMSDPQTVPENELMTEIQIPVN
jgi:effector-binding domain-containing protein